MGWFQEAKIWKRSDPSVTYRQIAEKFGVAKQTVKNRFCAERKRNQGTKFLSAEELVQQEKAKLQRQHEQRVLQQLVKERGRTELMCDAVREAIAVLPEFSFPEFRPINSEYDDEDAMLIISDCQIGQVVDPEETGGLGEYNLEVFKQRRRALTKSVRKIVKIHSNAYNVRRLFVPFLGDIVENDIIFRGQKDYVDADVVSQVFIAADEFCSMLLELAQDFEEIHVIGIGGNHGRTGRKGENRTWVNWDYIAYKFMEERLRNQSRIKFYIPKSWWTLLEVRGHSFLLLHGDDIKCFLPGASVSMADGTVKAIEDIKAEDRVLTHTGSIKKVTETYKYEHHGKIMVIEADCLPERTWMVTPNHEVPVVFRSQLICGHERHLARAGRRCSPIVCGHDPVLPEIQWVPASHVSVGDYLVVPRPAFGPETKVVQTDKYMNRPRSNHYKERNIPAEIEADRDIALLLGHYLADGNATRGAVEIAFNRDEKEFWGALSQAIERSLGIQCKLVNTSRKVWAERLQIYSSQVASLIAGLGGKGSRTKRIHPDVLTWPVEALKWLLIGYLRGDGHTARSVYHRTHRVQASTMSVDLGWQLFWIARKCGYSPSIKKRNRSGKAEMRLIFYGDDARKLGSLTQRNYSADDDSIEHHVKASIIDIDAPIPYSLVRAGAVWMEDYDGPKYDLTIEGEHTYTVNGAGVHNSWNSIPYYGIDRADARWTKMLQVNQLSYEYMLIGHHHNSATIDSPVGEKIVNGCWPGGSQYSLKQLNVSSKPSQWFFGVHERRGISWRYKIDLVAGPYGGG